MFVAKRAHQVWPLSTKPPLISWFTTWALPCESRRSDGQLLGLRAAVPARSLNGKRRPTLVLSPTAIDGDLGEPVASQSTEIDAACVWHHFVVLHAFNPYSHLFILFFSESSFIFSILPSFFAIHAMLRCHFLCPDFDFRPPTPNPPTSLIHRSFLHFSPAPSALPAGHPHFFRYARVKKAREGKKRKDKMSWMYKYKKAEHSYNPQWACHPFM